MYKLFTIGWQNIELLIMYCVRHVEVGVVSSATKRAFPIIRRIWNASHMCISWATLTKTDCRFVCEINIESAKNTNRQTIPRCHTVLVEGITRYSFLGFIWFAIIDVIKRSVLFISSFWLYGGRGLTAIKFPSLFKRLNIVLVNIREWKGVIFELYSQEFALIVLFYDIPVLCFTSHLILHLETSSSKRKGRLEWEITQKITCECLDLQPILRGLLSSMYKYSY